MPRSKKQQKIRQRSWINKDEEEQCYNIVMKNPIFYKQPVHTHGKVVLYGDVIIDVNSFIQNQSYIPKLQLGISKINKIVKLLNEKQIIIYTETLCPQLTDFTSIINILKSLSSSESYQLAQQLEKHQELTNRQLKLYDDKKESNQQIALHYDPEVLLKKCQEIVKQNLDFEGQIFAFNLYTFDPDKKRLNRYLATHDVKLLLLLCDDEEELKRRFLSYKINQPQGNMNQFIKIQIPIIDKQVEEEIKIYTFDNYIINSKITQVCIKLSENSNNILMLRKYNFEPQDLQELKRVRQLKRQQHQQIVTQLLLEQSQNSCSQSQLTENLFTHESQSFSIQTFLQKFEDNENTD
ncbi:hypothetical protein TTHERM_00713500 (macronuclear) [Tetrahymena thermophila SB210]|uniref:Uncharacterized protein n=1 Tax=Tetrahymena thermophila (strain SB210) TaxID=312017 RepID=Q24CV2_TETTS|nr:hypothetical protein TTHERM_00713500 [Tetrahymena thermophila SB210]EAS05656.1 hypothetical protein TTHERM_00713500 [Tetrahymena thermophila SB210]|eukprot:XP_001025901.1 hypothetical protein TTHERM_00713500 [Tetrahymena thermophila SB210]